MFKSISENRIRNNMNFGKHFPKTICEGKIGILEGLKETWGERKEKIVFCSSILQRCLNFFTIFLPPFYFSRALCVSILQK
jgi:hypothetical protein